MAVNLVGTGCGSIDNMTVEAQQAIENSNILIGFERVLAILGDTNKTLYNEYRAEKILDIIIENLDKNISVLFSGDSGFYSGCKRLAMLLDEKNIRYKIIPGISSVQYFAAKLGVGWQSWKLVSAHGEECDIVREVMRDKKVFVLTGGKTLPNTLCKNLCDSGLGSLKVHIGENLSYNNERIISATAAEIAQMEIAPLSVMLCDNIEVPKRSLGIPDNEFIRGKVPMTKRLIRASVVSFMNPQINDVIWDIGAGTGSVSVELALNCNRLFAVEKNAEAVALIEENRRKFGAYNIDVIHGEAPACLDDLPTPDRVFIGGSSGNIGEIISLAHSKNSEVEFCITAITIETLTRSLDALKSIGFEAEITQLTVANSHHIGASTMMKSENPVYIIRGAR